VSSVVNRLGSALAGVLERPVESIEEKDRRSARATLVVGNAAHELELRWVGRGWPADVEQALDSVPDPWPRQLVLVGQQFSPGAVDKLTQRRANWLDETGAARIETDSGLLVFREPDEAAAERGMPRGLRWAPSSLEIAEWLLTDPRREPFNAREFVDRSSWSYAQTTKVLRQLSARGWVNKTGGSRGVGSGWQLADPSGLLEAWTTYLVSHRPETVGAHRVLRDPMQFARTELAKALSPEMQWALSGWAGLELAAPFVTTVPVIQIAVDTNALVDGRLREVMRTVGLREVSEGARIEFLALSKFSLSLSREFRGLPVVSPPRLYADLRTLGGRGEEAAEHVRQELIHV
jgi:Transcriptional regulator, AbiEi antitoxin, Type IV TA system